jgi:peroxiredoxin
MIEAPKERLAPGDRAPNFALLDHRGKHSMFYERTRGRLNVILLPGASRDPRAPAVLQAFADRAQQLAAANIDLFAIALADPQTVRAAELPFHLWSDPEGKVRRAYLDALGLDVKGGAGDEALALLLDANQRLLAVQRGAELAERVLAFYRARPAPPAPRVRAAVAPVLLIPGLIDLAMCRALAALAEGARPGGQEVADPRLVGPLRRVIGRRVAPELLRAFSFAGISFDGLHLHRRDAGPGERIAARREAAVPGHVERRFILSIDLDAEGYVGGAMNFPEYGSDLYRAGTGGGTVFSCSLIADVQPVTRGRRLELRSYLKPLPAQA